MVFVNLNQCLPAYYGERLETVGLDTCIGIVAYGLPAQQGGVNKVMAHCSTGNESAVIGHSFVRAVQSSRMRLAGICMSCPRSDRNDHGPGRISDSEIKRLIAQSRRIHESQVTGAMIREFRRGLASRLSEAVERARAICIDQLRVGPVVTYRDNAHVLHPDPYGTLVAAASPNGRVTAEGHEMATIPNQPATATSASASPAKSAGNSPAYAGSSSARDRDPRYTTASPSKKSDAKYTTSSASHTGAGGGGYHVSSTPKGKSSGIRRGNGF